METKLSFRKKLALKAFKKYKANTAKLHELSYLMWECTLRCNLNCIHCGSDCKKNSLIEDFPKEKFLEIIDQIKPHVNSRKTIIVITGGEALMRNDLEEIGLELYKKEFPWGIVSNGYLLNERRFQSLLQSGLRSITISLDGFEEAHNWLRGNKNSYRKALSAIKLLPTANNLVYDVVSCVNQKNFDELEAFRDFLIEIGIKAWRIFTIFPIGRAKENKELQLKPKQFKQLFDFIADTRKKGKIKLNYGCEGFLGNYEGKVRDNFFFCKAGINIASILADGSISACPNLRDNFIQGNVFKDNFINTWNNKFEIMRNRNWTKKGECNDCKYYRYCEGNGLHLRDEKNGDLLFCHLKRIEEAYQ